MYRIRYATTPDAAPESKLTGTVEVDERYVGGKPRPLSKYPRRLARAKSRTAFSAGDRSTPRCRSWRLSSGMVRCGRRSCRP